jgi:hypothetical protein
MKTMVKIALVTGVLALASGGSALAEPIYTPDGTPHGEPGPKAGLPSQAKAYGRRCKGESKKHVKGEKGTAFSRCVANLKQAANHKNMAPGQVCKGESKEHVKGEKGTEFSRCVKKVVKLRKQERQEAAAQAA